MAMRLVPSSGQLVWTGANYTEQRGLDIDTGTRTLVAP